MQSVRLMGDGYEPHVTQEEGKLTYSLPVDSGFISYEFAFEISRHDQLPVGSHVNRQG